MAIYQVDADGKGPSGMSVGDEVVTAAGTYTVKGVNEDGTYQSELTNKDQTTSNYTGGYSTVPGTPTTGGGTPADVPATETPASATPTTTGGKTYGKYTLYNDGDATTMEKMRNKNVDLAGQTVAYQTPDGIWTATYNERGYYTGGRRLTGGRFTQEYLDEVNARLDSADSEGNNGATVSGGNYYGSSSGSSSGTSGWNSGAYSSGVQIPNVDASSLVNQWSSQIPDVDKAKSDQMALLEQWKNTLIEQNNGQIDYNVAKAITELERALEDAQPQYKEQQESIAKDERQALDNSALYAEARGDKGGIGQEQYNSIMNTAAQNRLSVQQAQTKLATDTQRQIADLRAQGEFDKADAALEVSQQYLSQLMSLEQWAFDAGMSVAQFKVSLEQWAKDYELAMAQFQVSVDQWNMNFAYQQYRDSVSDSQWQQTFDYNKGQDAINNEMNWAQIMGTTSSGAQTLDYQKYLYGQEQDKLSNDLSWAQIMGTTSTGEQTLAYQQYLANQEQTAYNRQKNIADYALESAMAGLVDNLSPLQYEAIKAVYNMDQTEVDTQIAAAKLAAKNEQDLAWAKLNASKDSKDEDTGTKMTLANAKLMAEAGQFTDAVLQAFYDAGFTDTYLTETYGYEPSKQGSTDRTTYGTKYDKASVEAMNTAKAWIAKHMDAKGNLPEGDEAYQIFLSAVEKVLDKYGDSELSKDGLSAILDMLKTMWGSPLATSNANPINNTFKWDFSRLTN